MSHNYCDKKIGSYPIIRLKHCRNYNILIVWTVDSKQNKFRKRGNNSKFMILFLVFSRIVDANNYTIFEVSIQ